MHRKGRVYERVLCLFNRFFPYQSCNSSTQPSVIKNPDYKILKQFKIETTGQVIYQLYQKYGFTDIEEQLVLVLKPKTPIVLKNKLPATGSDFARLNRIDGNKFLNKKALSIEQEKNVHSDVIVESIEFGSALEIKLELTKGSFQIFRTKGNETMYIFDEINVLVYIESKK